MYYIRVDFGNIGIPSFNHPTPRKLREVPRLPHPHPCTPATSPQRISEGAEKEGGWCRGPRYLHQVNFPLPDPSS
eukprot:765817-Hanusia_phi.AAC.1